MGDVPNGETPIERDGRWVRVAVLCALIGSASVPDAAASGCVWFNVGAPSAEDYEAITAVQRLEWVTCGSVGVGSLGVGIVNAAVPRWFNTLDEWKKAQSGF